MYKHYIDFCIIFINLLSTGSLCNKTFTLAKSTQLHLKVGTVMQHDYCEQPRLTGTEDAPEQSWPKTFQQSLTKTYNVIKKNQNHNLGSLSDCSSN